jgi:protein required for attachment to host cells
MLLPHGTVVALVDGKRFELFRNIGKDSHPELSTIESPRLDEHNKGSGARHHASAAEPSGHQLQEDAHAAAVVDWLNHQVASNAIKDLVVIAPARALGEMRRHYSPMLKAVLRGDFTKEIVGSGGDGVLDALRRGIAS